MTRWTGDLYKHVVIGFEKSSWAVEEILHSKIMDEVPPYEEKTILRCKQVTPTPGKTAIIKAHLQIPDDTGELPDGESVNAVVKTEIECMKHLTANGCPSAPRLIAYSQMKQPEGMCLPGGYLVCILMEMVPGKMIMDFWDYNRATRDRIRKAFKKSWLEVNAAYVYNVDCGLRNLLWDENTGKCYILDYEDAEIIKKPHSWSESEYVVWELLQTRFGVRTW